MPNTALFLRMQISVLKQLGARACNALMFARSLRLDASRLESDFNDPVALDMVLAKYVHAGIGLAGFAATYIRSIASEHVCGRGSHANRL